MFYVWNKINIVWPSFLMYVERKFQNLVAIRKQGELYNLELIFEKKWNESWHSFSFLNKATLHSTFREWVMILGVFKVQPLHLSIILESMKNFKEACRYHWIKISPLVYSIILLFYYYYYRANILQMHQNVLLNRQIQTIYIYDVRMFPQVRQNDKDSY